MKQNASTKGKEQQTYTPMIKFALFDYVPQRFIHKASGEERTLHGFILKFKDGEKAAQIKAAQYVGRALCGRDRTQYVFVCVPASSPSATARRYKNFSNQVCRICGAQNGYDHISVEGRKSKLHTSLQHQIGDADQQRITVDADFFAGKKVIVFDDIVTTGKTSDAFARIMTEAGANVVGCIFLAKTKMIYPP